jgi:hypothetical protein
MLRNAAAPTQPRPSLRFASGPEASLDSDPPLAAQVSKQDAEDPRHGDAMGRLEGCAYAADDLEHRKADPEGYDVGALDWLRSPTPRRLAAFE